MWCKQVYSVHEIAADGNLFEIFRFCDISLMQELFNLPLNFIFGSRTKSVNKSKSYLEMHYYTNKYRAILNKILQHAYVIENISKVW